MTKASHQETNGAGDATTPPSGIAPPFPVESFKEAAPHLRRPFAPNAVRWKVQTGALVVPYVDARTVIERLNLVVPHLWSAEYTPWGERVDSNLLVCHLTIDGLTRSDIGKGPKNETQKGAYSDALKRAAVHFGVSVSLYAMNKVFLNVSKDGAKDAHGVPTLKKTDKSTEITPALETWLRQTYGKWLETDRGKHFGDALDHGDSPDAIGDPVEAAPTGEPTQDDLLLSAKRQEAEAVYAEIPAAKRPKLPPARFKAKLDASTDGQLDEFIAELTELSRA